MAKGGPNCQEKRHFSACRTCVIGVFYRQMAAETAPDRPNAGVNADVSAVAPHPAGGHPAGARRRIGACRRRRGLSEPSGDHHCAVRARRRHRHSGPHARAKARAAPQQAVRGREPPRRRHGDRDQLRRQFPARRLHHREDGVVARHRRDALQEAALRPGQGFGAGSPDRIGAVRAGGEPVVAGDERRRSHQARQAAAAELRLRRHRRLPSPRRLAVRQHGRHQDDARAVSRHGAGAQRSARRLHPTHVQRSPPASCGRWR